MKCLKWTYLQLQQHQQPSSWSPNLSQNSSLSSFYAAAVPHQFPWAPSPKPVIYVGEYISEPPYVETYNHRITRNSSAVLPRIYMSLIKATAEINQIEKWNGMNASMHEFTPSKQIASVSNRDKENQIRQKVRGKTSGSKEVAFSSDMGWSLPVSQGTHFFFSNAISLEASAFIPCYRQFPLYNKPIQISQASR